MIYSCSPWSIWPYMTLSTQSRKSRWSCRWRRRQLHGHHSSMRFDERNMTALQLLPPVFFVQSYSRKPMWIFENGLNSEVSSWPWVLTLILSAVISAWTTRSSFSKGSNSTGGRMLGPNPPRYTTLDAGKSHTGEGYLPSISQHAVRTIGQLIRTSDIPIIADGKRTIQSIDTDMWTQLLWLMTCTHFGALKWP